MAFRCRCQSLTFDEGRASATSTVAPTAGGAAPVGSEGRARSRIGSTRFMCHLLPHCGEETTRHQFAQDQAELLALADRQQLPQLVQGNRRFLTRWRWGGAHGLKLSDMAHLLVAKTGVAGTTVPAVTTPTR